MKPATYLFPFGLRTFYLKFYLQKRKRNRKKNFFTIIFSLIWIAIFKKLQSILSTAQEYFEDFSPMGFEQEPAVLQ